MTVNEHTAKSVNELVVAAVEIARGFGDTRPWWRGHVNESWNLVPSLYRMQRSESNMNNRFRDLARARYDGECPEHRDLFGWLFLMQHYNLPTRLLDWTESPLIALFFATENPSADDKDAEVWAIAPTKLNL